MSQAASAALPRLATVEEFAQHLGLKVHQGYAHLKHLPDDCLFRLGKRVWINLDNLRAHMDQGKPV